MLTETSSAQIVGLLPSSGVLSATEGDSLIWDGVLHNKRLLSWDR